LANIRRSYEENKTVPFFVHNVYVAYAVSYSGWKSYVSNYFYRIALVGLLYDAERDLLATAKFFVGYFAA